MLCLLAYLSSLKLGLPFICCI